MIEIITLVMGVYRNLHWMGWVHLCQWVCVNSRSFHDSASDETEALSSGLLENPKSEL